MATKKMVLQFLSDRNVDQDEIDKVETRIEAVENPGGTFPDENLPYVMGDAKLAAEYERAWDTGKLFARAWK